MKTSRKFYILDNHTVVVCDSKKIRDAHIKKHGGMAIDSKSAKIKMWTTTGRRAVIVQAH